MRYFDATKKSFKNVVYLVLTLHDLLFHVSVDVKVGRDPTIHIWDATSMKTLAVLKGQHQRGVCAVDFSGKQRVVTFVTLLLGFYAGCNTLIIVVA